MAGRTSDVASRVWKSHDGTPRWSFGIFTAASTAVQPCFPPRALFSPAGRAFDRACDSPRQVQGGTVRPPGHGRQRRPAAGDGRADEGRPGEEPRIVDELRRSVPLLCPAMLGCCAAVPRLPHCIVFTGSPRSLFRPSPALRSQLQDIRFVFAFSDELSHFLYGAADMILVPSIFEPCGLTQMIGQRYGAVPIVRKTGGLADTVDPSPDSGTGFVFEGQAQPDVIRAVEDALTTYGDEGRWSALVKRCMGKDNRRAALTREEGRVGAVSGASLRPCGGWFAAVATLTPCVLRCQLLSSRCVALNKSLNTFPPLPLHSWDTSFATYANIYNTMAK